MSYVSNVISHNAARSFVANEDDCVPDTLEPCPNPLVLRKDVHLRLACNCAYNRFCCMSCAYTSD